MGSEMCIRDRVKTGEMVPYGRAGQLQYTRREVDLNLHQSGKQFHTILPSTPGWDAIENDTLSPNQWWTRAEISQLATAGGLGDGRTIGILNPMMRTITMHVQTIPLRNLDCIFVDADVDYSDGRFLGVAIRETDPSIFKKFRASAAPYFKKICEAATPGIYDRTVLVTANGPTTPLTTCLLYTSPSPRDLSTSRMPSSA